MRQWTKDPVTPWQKTASILPRFLTNKSRIKLYFRILSDAGALFFAYPVPCADCILWLQWWPSRASDLLLQRPVTSILRLEDAKAGLRHTASLLDPEDSSVTLGSLCRFKDSRLHLGHTASLPDPEGSRIFQATLPPSLDFY